MMKKFLINLIVFLSFVILMLGIFGLFMTSMRAKYCTTNAHILISGNSTVEYGVDDFLIPNSLNIGFNADHMDFIYAKIKLIKKYSPSIDTVLIAIDDALMRKDVSQGYSSELHHPFYYDQYDINDILFILKNTSFDWVESTIARPCRADQLRTLLQNICKPSVPFKELGVGGYYILDRHKLEDEIASNTSDERRSEHLLTDEKEMYLFSIYFLNKIKNFCDNNNIKIIFFTTPKHSNANARKFYRSICNELFPDVEFHDFTDFPTPNIYFGDSYHLNTDGAKYFTPILYDAIKK